MHVLVVGSGGREHALAWKIAKSPLVDRLSVAPGNAGTEGLPLSGAREPLGGSSLPSAGQPTSAKSRNVGVAAEDLDALVAHAREHDVDLVVVGPEAPLCAGLTDALAEHGIPAFGPTAAGAKLEGSKAFCKTFLSDHGIPTAPFQVVTDMDAAADYIGRCSRPQVVKADGLAAGKGVIVCNTPGEARQAAKAMLVGGRFGEAGATVVIEERLEGEEASFMALCDGLRALPLASSQDHKRALDGDRGPNTGGMGAYSPAPVVTADRAAQIQETIIAPIAKGMAGLGTPYRGVIYAGLMVQGDKIQVLEVNCRLGDPETQPVLMRLDEDLVPLLQATAEGRLESRPLVQDPRATLCVVMASGGYPGAYEKGYAIEGLSEVETLPDVEVFHAGTARDSDGRVVTAGGRVLGVTAKGDTLREARSQAYLAVERIRWTGVYYRKDIAYRAL